MIEALDLDSPEVPISLAKFGPDGDTVEELLRRTYAEIIRIRNSLAEGISWSEPVPTTTPSVPTTTPSVPTKKTLNGELWRGGGSTRPPVTRLKLELD